MFINRVEIYKFETNVAPFCLSNVSKDFSVNNVRKTGLYQYIYDFSVDYDSIDVDILDIQKYLMKNHKRKTCLD